MRKSGLTAISQALSEEIARQQGERVKKSIKQVELINRAEFFENLKTTHCNLKTDNNIELASDLPGFVKPGFTLLSLDLLTRA